MGFWRFDVSKLNGPIPKDAHQRFWRKVEFEPGGCWLWKGPTNGVGYGYFYLHSGVRGQGGRMVLAHRWSYEQIFGLIPYKQVIDHLCREPSCVHPLHLEVVSYQDNILRGVSNSPISGVFKSRQTRCIRGHEFTEQNTYMTKKGHRHCRQCHAVEMSLRRREKKMRVEG